jgi:hypothetical protein
MRAAASLLALIVTLAACNDSPQQAEANNSAVTEVEALPPDESVATPTDQLDNGADEPANTGNATY